MTRAVGVLATASGACGLVYEVLWLKSLGLFVGQTTVAVSLVVAAFLGGLVLGSLSLGRWADRVSNPLWLFAALELSTGLCGLGVTALLSRLPELTASLGLPGGGPLPVRIALGFLVVLPPTWVMGGTLPALTRFAVRDLASVGRSFGLLYAFNTLGAAVGCGVAGFYLIGRFGLQRTAVLAAGLNATVALLALLLGRWASRARAPAPEAPEPPPPADAARRRRRLLALFALCGFGSISYEVLWFRALSSFLESTAYAFALLLSVFLLGLVLGGLLYSTRLIRARPLELLASAQSLLAFAGVVSVALLGQSRAVGQLLPGALGAVGLGSGRYLAMFLQAGLIILAPTLLIGIIFPLVAQLTVEQLQSLGHRVGLLYSVNTLGGIVGSLAMGLVFIPWLGTQRSFALICLLNMGVALAAERLDPQGTPGARRRLLASALLLAGCFLLLPRDYLVRAFSEFRNARVLAVREGKDGTLAVLEYDRRTICGSGDYDCRACDLEFHHRQLVFGSISYASTVLPARRYMRTLAHLPMMLHPGARDVLEVCFGTGTTAGSFARYDRLRTLTLVDLNRDVFALAPYFADSNHGVLSDPRVRARVDDGRHYLRTHPETYDVISFEPPPPTAQGAVNLYSEEFYRLARARLRPGGVMAQWIPLDQQSDRLSRMLIRSMLEAFPEVALWIPSRLEGVVLASDRPIQVNLPDWERQWTPAIREDLADVGFQSPDQLAAGFVMGTGALRRYTGGLPPVTDDAPAAEYFLSQGDRPFSAEALLAQAQPMSAALGAPGAEDPGAPRLQTLADAQRLLTRAHQSARDRDYERAHALLDDAARLGGETAFTAFLRKLEYGCLVPNRRRAGAR